MTVLEQPWGSSLTCLHLSTPSSAAELMPEFISDEELQRAKAEVEECYRRRAWRAGLGDSLPEGRPMTEEELEDLQWQLGDFGPAGGYGSCGAKRRKDPADMSIEEMEAELEETKELIRKRRRGNLGLMLKPIWTLMIVACLAGGPASAFTAYDCSDQNNIVESYSLLEPDTCANSGKDGEVETTVYGEIVQIKQDRMVPVFRCTVIETLVAQHCRQGRRTRASRTASKGPWYGSTTPWSATRPSSGCTRG